MFPYQFTDRYRTPQLVLALVVGISLLPMVPIGYLFGTHSIPFEAAFFVHGGCLLLATLHATAYFIALARRCSAAAILPLLFLLIVIAAIFASSLLPPTDAEALFEHLAFARWWHMQGSFHPFSWGGVSVSPSLLQLAFIPFVAHGFVNVIPAYHSLYLFLLCTNTSIFVFHKTRENTPALLAWLLPLSLPICLSLASAPLVDLSVALYAGCALFALCYWTESTTNRSLLLASGIALGLAMAAQQHGLFLVPALTLSLLLLCSRYSIKFRNSVHALLLVVLGAALSFLPWYISPFIFPSHVVHQLFPPFAHLGQRFVPELYGNPSYPPLATLLTATQPLLDGVMVLLIILTAAPLIRRNSPPYRLSLTLFAVVYTVGTLFFAPPHIEYLAPLYAPLCALGALEVYSLFQSLSQRRSTLAFYAMTCLVIGTSLSYPISLIQKSWRIHHSRNHHGEDAYLLRIFPEFRVVTFMNENFDQSSTTYVANSDNIFFYYHTPVIGESHPTLLIREIQSASGPEELLLRFHELNILHLALHNQRTKEDIDSVLTLDQRFVWHKFQEDHLLFVHGGNGYSLWRVF